MSQQQPRSNLIQLLLIASVIFLGMQLFMPRNTEPPAPIESLREAYAKAVESQKLDEVMSRGRALASRLRREESSAAGDEKAALLAEARQVEFSIAEAELKKAEATKDFNVAVTAYQAFETLAHEAKGTEIGKQAEAKRVEARSLAERLPKSGMIQVGYDAIDLIVAATGRLPWFSYWFAALLMALIVRGLVWPLSAKQIIGFKRMAMLQPMIKELQEKYQGVELQQRVAKLYSKYGINPLAGCWPALVQMPFFIWVFYCMNAYRFEFQHGYFLWVNPKTAGVFPGIVAPNLGERDFPLIILYGISMIITSLVTPTDPQNARQAKIMGIVLALVFSVMMLFWVFPSAFIIYWIGINILSTAQSIIMSRKPLPPLVEVPEGERKNGIFGGLVPKEGAKGSAKVVDTIKSKEKTGAPVLHKPKGGKQGKKKKRR